MSSARDVAAGFSITGLLDESARTRERFPIVEIDAASISDHPANIAYLFITHSECAFSQSSRLGNHAENFS